MGKTTEKLLGVLTGAVGDWLHASGNGLATPLGLVHDGSPLPLTTAAIRAALPDAGPDLVVLIHGLMATEHGFAMGDGAADFGTLLRDHKGLTPLRLRFNSGREAAQSGHDLALLLERLLAVWPVRVRGIALVCHSMGGLVVRAAAGIGEAAGHKWCRKISHVVYLGTPHLGAPLEEAGRKLTAALRELPDPVAQLLGQLGDFRSAGIQQLGDPAPLPWPRHGRQLLVASSLAGATPLAAIVGDGMVSVRSALADDPRFPRPAAAETRVLSGLHHAQLAFSPRVAELLLAWLPEPPQQRRRASRAAAVQQPPGPVTPSRRGEGLLRLGLGAGAAGQRAVAEVRLGRADQALAAVRVLAPGLAAPAAAAHALHAGVVAVQHGAISAGLATVEALVATARAAPAPVPDAESITRRENSASTPVAPVPNRP